MNEQNERGTYLITRVNAGFSIKLKDDVEGEGGIFSGDIAVWMLNFVATFDFDLMKVFPLHCLDLDDVWELEGVKIEDLAELELKKYKVPRQSVKE